VHCTTPGTRVRQVLTRCEMSSREHQGQRHRHHGLEKRELRRLCLSCSHRSPPPHARLISFARQTRFNIFWRIDPISPPLAEATTYGPLICQLDSLQRRICRVFVGVDPRRGCPHNKSTTTSAECKTEHSLAIKSKPSDGSPMCSTITEVLKGYRNGVSR